MLTIDPRYFPGKQGDYVLDLGCGEGRHITGLLALIPGLHFVGIDISKDDLEKTRHKLEEFYPKKVRQCCLIQATGLKIPFSDNSFDHIICSEVLEHIKSFDFVLNEINRVLKPGGSFCVSVPRAWPEKICWHLSTGYHQVEGGHVRIFDERALTRSINGKGFTYQLRHWAHALHSPYWWLKCAFWQRGDDFVLLRWYHKFLVWDLMKKPRLTHWLEKLLNPICGKSVVLYFQKNHTALLSNDNLSF